MTPQTRVDMPLIITIMLVALTFVLVAYRHARAADLPNGITCEQVVQAATYLNIPNTHQGHERVRRIASAVGIALTKEQIVEAAKCLHRER